MYNLSQQDTYGWCSVMAYNSHIDMQPNPSDETKYIVWMSDTLHAQWNLGKICYKKFLKKNVNVFIANKIDF